MKLHGVENFHRVGRQPTMVALFAGVEKLRDYREPPTRAPGSSSNTGSLRSEREDVQLGHPDARTVTGLSIINFCVVSKQSVLASERSFKTKGRGRRSCGSPDTFHRRLHKLEPADASAYFVQTVRTAYTPRASQQTVRRWRRLQRRWTAKLREIRSGRRSTRIPPLSSPLVTRHDKTQVAHVIRKDAWFM